MSTVIGVDSSTQSCKVLAVDAQSREVITTGAAAHPDLTAVDPHVWTSALRVAWRAAGATGWAVPSRRPASPPSSTGWWPSTVRGRPSTMPCCGTTRAVRRTRHGSGLNWGPKRGWTPSTSSPSRPSPSPSWRGWRRTNLTARAAWTRWSSPTTGSTEPCVANAPRTGAMPPAPATSPPSPTATGPTCWNASSDAYRAFRAWWRPMSRPERYRTAGASTEPSSPPAPGTTRQRLWASGCARARWWSRSAPQEPSSPAHPPPCRVLPAPSQDSRTQRAATCPCWPC